MIKLTRHARFDRAFVMRLSRRERLAWLQALTDILKDEGLLADE